MFNLPENRAAKGSSQKSVLEDIQYELCKCYIKYASEQLADKEARLIEHASDLLERIASQPDQKELTEVCTTEASIANFSQSEGQSSYKSSEKKMTFKRKSKYNIDKQAAGNIAEALQEIKQVCGQKTIAIVEQVIAQHNKLGQLNLVNDFRVRQGNFRKKRERCGICDSKDAMIQLSHKEHQQKIKNLSLQIVRLGSKCQVLQQQLAAAKQIKVENSEKHIVVFNNCREYLKEKEMNLADRTCELKLIERQICNALSRTAQRDGCERCQIIRAIKEQVVGCRRYYEREAQNLQKLYQQYKKLFK